MMGRNANDANNADERKFYNFLAFIRVICVLFYLRSSNTNRHGLLTHGSPA